ncbi:heavy metal translocating P-type ATPase, partial [Maribacter sp.]|nr:heavy metal translocating P-type ATPase [Maribacter sp.]
MCAEHHHDHSHGILGKNTELYFALLSGATLLVGFLLEKLTEFDGTISWGLYLAAYFFGGYFVLREAITEISKGKFEIDFLMLVAAIGAGFLGKWAEGGLLLFLFSLGHALEHYAMGKARKSIAALTDLAPKMALLKKEGGFLEV